MNSKVRFGFLILVIFFGFSLSLAPESLNEREILDLVNQDRARLGLAELRLDPTLSLAALAKAQDMISKNYFAHTSPQGATPWHWFRSLGYNYHYAGENLAEGYQDEVELEKSWMASPAHRANILSPNYTDVGLGIVNYNNANLVVQLFGSKQQLTYGQ